MKRKTKGRGRGKPADLSCWTDARLKRKLGGEAGSRDADKLYGFINAEVRKAASEERKSGRNKSAEEWEDSLNMLSGLLFAADKTLFVENGEDIASARQHIESGGFRSPAYNKRKARAVLDLYERARVIVFPNVKDNKRI